MTQEQKAKAYDEALERAKNLENTTQEEDSLIKYIFPDISESEDERIIKTLYEYVKNRNWMLNGPTQGEVLAWLEKQKYDRMKPIYDARESFESALEKAWKDYNDSGARTVDGCEDDYVECAHAKGFREGYLFGFERQKKQKPNFDTHWENGSMVCKQKEQKPTDTEWDELQVDFRNINEAFENGKKEVVDNPERYGLCRPAEWSEEDEQNLNVCLSYIKDETLCQWLKDAIHAGYNKPVECIEFDNEFKKQVSHLLASVLNKDWEYDKGSVEYAAQQLLGYAKHEIQPVEWSEEDEKMRCNILNVLTPNIVYTPGSGTRTGTSTYKYDKEINWLKFLRPSWKPSKEQMEALNLLLCRGELSFMSQAKTLRSLYNDLEKLM